MVEQINVKKNSSDPEYETRLGRLTASLDLNVAFYFTNEPCHKMDVNVFLNLKYYYKYCISHIKVISIGTFWAS